MLHPLSEFPNGTSLKADVCIAGAGPAGISLALTLAERGISSILLEAGPEGSTNEAQQDPYKGSQTGMRYPLMSSRLRCFGGTSRHWGGWCKPIDDIDFTRRPSAPLPSWPIGPDELEPYYPRALDWCEIPSRNFTPESAVKTPETALLDLRAGGFMNRLFRFSPPTRFNQSWGDEVEASSLVTCICEATVTSLEFSGDQIQQANVAGSDGRSISVTADHFVLAMGGIEVTRFLLHMAQEHGASFGTQSGLLGTCFMDHFGFSPGFLEAPSGIRYLRHTEDGLPIMPVITAMGDMQRDQDWPSICVMANPVAPDGNLPPAYYSNPGILGGAGTTESQRYRLQLICEPTAHRASRITLGDERDAFGIRRLSLHWNIYEEDFERVESFMSQFQRAVGMAGAGRVQRTRRFVGDARLAPSVGWHHMGTTRMSDDPNFGVVDTDCRVNGSANLYIASSSVFPRVGYSNPTLTIVAFAERLAAHFVEGAT